MNKTEAKKTLKIVNKLGLHARAAALFVKLANRYQADIQVSKGKKQVNGKSIMGLLMLAAGQGSKITVQAAGNDAEDALKKIGALIADGFHEEQ